MAQLLRRGGRSCAAAMITIWWTACRNLTLGKDFHARKSLPVAHLLQPKSVDCH
jgi:hypothetical protein